MPDDVAMQAHNLAIRVEERVAAAEKVQDALRQELTAVRREMTDMYVALREKIDSVGRGVYALLWCAAGSLILALVGALAYVTWQAIQARPPIDQPPAYSAPLKK